MITKVYQVTISDILIPKISLDDYQYNVTINVENCPSTQLILEGVDVGYKIRSSNVSINQKVKYPEEHFEFDIELNNFTFL